MPPRFLTARLGRYVCRPVEKSIGFFVKKLATFKMFRRFAVAVCLRCNWRKHKQAKDTSNF